MSKTNTVCLFGMGGHGSVVTNQIRSFKNQDLVFADERSSVKGVKLNFHHIEEIPLPVCVTIGDNKTREELQNKAVYQAGPIVIEPERVLSGQIGDGSQILIGAIVNSDAFLGRGVIVNSGAIVEHDVFVDDFCHLAPGSVVGGGARLARRVFVGSNATVLPGVEIAADVIVGAGSVVTRNLDSAGVYVGSPAQLIDRG